MIYVGDKVRYEGLEYYVLAINGFKITISQDCIDGFLVNIWDLTKVMSGPQIDLQ